MCECYLTEHLFELVKKYMNESILLRKNTYLLSSCFKTKIIVIV